MIKHLATFKMVYETRSFSRAADLLFIAQPTVSAQIKQLETEFGTSLFVRNGRGELGVTSAAEQLYAKAVQLLATWDELHAELQEGISKTRCRIASSHTFATAILPELLPALAARFPQLQFSVQMRNSQGVRDDLAHHNAEIGFIEKPLAVRGLERTALLTDQLVHAGKTGPWLIREPDSGVYYYTRRYLEETGITPDMIQIDNNAVITQLLRAGFGQSIISARAATGIPSISLGPRFVREFYLMRRDTDLAPDIAACASEIVRWATARRLNELD